MFSIAIVCMEIDREKHIQRIMKRVEELCERTRISNRVYVCKKRNDDIEVKGVTVKKIPKE